jgi:hypothetical protein
MVRQSSLSLRTVLRRGLIVSMTWSRNPLELVSAMNWGQAAAG